MALADGTHRTASTTQSNGYTTPHIQNSNSSHTRSTLPRSGPSPTQIPHRDQPPSRTTVSSRAEPAKYPPALVDASLAGNLPLMKLIVPAPRDSACVLHSLVVSFSRAATYELAIRMRTERGLLTPQTSAAPSSTPAASCSPCNAGSRAQHPVTHPRD